MKRCALVLLVLLFPASAQADFDHVPGSPFGGVAQRTAVAVVDFDHDGLNDVAAAGAGSIVVRLGALATETVNEGGVALAAADFTGDQRTDLAVANGTNVTVLARQAAGGFSAETPIAVAATALAVADFNADARPDLAAVTSTGVTTLLRQSNPGFTNEGATAAGTDPRDVVVADFNADTRPDLAVLHAGGVTVLARQAGGGFQAELPVAAGANPRALTTGDFNADTRPDLAVANHDADSVSVLIRQAGGGFTPEPAPAAGDGPNAIAAADFNRDGRTDIAVTNELSEDMTILRRTAAGGFTLGPPGPHLFAPRRLVAAQLDADQAPDLALAQGGLAWLQNVPSTMLTSPPLDITNDTTPTFTFSSDEAGVTFECSLNGDTFTACTSPHTTAPLEDGEKQFYVRARRGTAVDRTPARADFGIDTMPPDTQITGGPPFTFSGQEGGGYECRIVPAAFAPCTSPHTVNGAGVFEVRARDAAGNADPTPAQRVIDGNVVTPGPTPPAPPPPPPGPLPRNTAPPSIQGAQVTQNYSCTEGSWEYASSFTYAWYRDFSFSADQLASSGYGYKLPAAYIGDRFYCVVTAHNANGSTAAVSPRVVISGITNEVPVVAGVVFGNIRLAGIDVFQVTQRKNDLAAGPRANYAGVSLDVDKPTTAVVHVRMDSKPAISGHRLEVALTIIRNGQRYVTLYKEISDPPVSTTAHVTEAERDTQQAATFNLTPYLPALANGEFDLEATVGLPLTAVYKGIEQCRPSVCTGDDRFRLDRVSVRRLPWLTIGVVRLTGAQSLNPTKDVFARAKQLWPGGDRWLTPELGTIDVGAEETLALDSEKCKKLKDTTLRNCRQAYVGDRLMKYGWDLKAAMIGGIDVLAGIHDYFDDADGKEREPGWSMNGDLGNGKLPMALLNDGDAPRKTDSAAHEMGHVLSAPHAGLNCGANDAGQVGEEWLPDNDGRLQGIKYDPETSLDPALDVDTAKLFDTMSYCRNLADSWLSPRNWTRAFALLNSYHRPAVFQAANRQALVTGAGDAILGVVAPDGSDQPPPADPASPLRVRALAADGRVIGESGARILRTTDGGTETFTGAAPAAAASIQLVRNGAVVSTFTRSRPPTVRVRSASARRVTWTASDPDGGPLDVTVEYSADGRVWQPVFAGPSRGSARLGTLAGSRRGRVRVSASDGFNETTALSTPFVVRAKPQPPTIISAPRSVTAGEPVSFTGSAGTWYAGTQRLGRGETITTRLTRTTTIRLVAGGGQASKRVRVTPVPAVLLEVDAPTRVKPGTKTVKVRYRTTAGRGSVSVRLPGTPALGVLKVPVKAIGLELTITRA